mmetsp:Transcript_15106/g.45750  ORF Transcript_15106/g.45750 Transcript_15106/m.45750 type:complete len:264 (-) Transcript_15106:133-924(-)
MRDACSDSGRATNRVFHRLVSAAGGGGTSSSSSSSPPLRSVVVFFGSGATTTEEALAAAATAGSSSFFGGATVVASSSGAISDDDLSAKSCAITSSAADCFAPTARPLVFSSPSSWSRGGGDSFWRLSSSSRWALSRSSAARARRLAVECCRASAVALRTCNSSTVAAFRRNASNSDSRAANFAAFSRARAARFFCAPLSRGLASVEASPCCSFSRCGAVAVTASSPSAAASSGDSGTDVVVVFGRAAAPRDSFFFCRCFLPM